MKFTISWLKDYLTTNANIDEIHEAMTMAGLEVEEIENPGEKLGAFSVAKIIEAVQHPNADKLRVCQVDTFQGRLEIVCGAPNARAGLTTIFAPIGTCVEALGVTLEAKPVRGVVSNGMMCSYSELGIEGDSSGIIELPNDIEVGTPAAIALGLNDAVIDFEVTPNRPDWLGVNSIARELSARGLGEFKDREIKKTDGGFDCPVAILTPAPDACPIFAGRVVRGVKNGPSPKWLQERLTAIGLRPINTLVDITNFISYDRARPLHVYDLNKLKGNIAARMGKEGESFVALDGKTYEITPNMCVIADDSGVLGLGGIMGGESTGCDENTTDVFIESAYFAPLSIFQTGRATGIQSDAKYRFERGVDPDFVIGGLDLATQMVLELCGGEASKMAVSGEKPTLPKPLDFNPKEITRLTGFELSNAQIIEILGRLGFECVDNGASLHIKVPSWRGDVKEAADIVEDVARIYGFDKLPMAQLSTPKNRQLISREKQSLNIARRALASFGYNEVVTWSFVKKTYAALFGANLENKTLELANPINDELEYMRPSALINLIAAAGRNIAKGFDKVSIFEAGPIYLSDAIDGQKSVIAAIATGETRNWNGAIKPDVYSIQADLMAVLGNMGAPIGGLMMSNGASSHFHPGRSGQLKMGKAVAAEFGQIHPKIAKALGVSQDIFGFEIFIDTLPKAKQKASKARTKLELSPFMPLSRDFAFIIDKDKNTADLVRAVQNADKNLIKNVNVFDVYSGKGVEDGKVSIALEVMIAPQSATLTDADIDTLSQKILAAASKQGAVLRA
ncbi:MAG: phenylalanine--tRNA ligase subunit beta [Proteobacteria bacterium]|nr:phenylalanine--tRNA ligase subunit beta [Pseudomonadota bacterium]